MTFLGVDIGTASSKAVVTDERGDLLACVARPHATSSPQPGWFEHDADSVWWGDTVALIAEVGCTVSLSDVQSVAVSGIGPAVVLTDGSGSPLRPGILYGIDTRAGAEITALTKRFGDDALLAVTGNRLTTQAVGPKLAWVAGHEPQLWVRARRWYSSSSYIVGRLTGEYVADHYTASASDPLYDLEAGRWWPPGWAACAPSLEQPRLAWPDEIVGEITTTAAAQTGLRAGTPVLAGTIDALAESYSAGCTEFGDTMVMYGSTMFFIELVACPQRSPGLWAVGGRRPGMFGIAAGMATSGLVTTWLAELVGSDAGELIREAATVPAGSHGLVMLPYLSGERTPLFDAEARGCWIGLTLQHHRADLARAALEGVAFGVRHNIETMADAGSAPRRLVAVGGGTRGALWTHIVSDVTGLIQDLPTVTIGASYGDARMAADALGVDTAAWNPVADRIEPVGGVVAETYDALYGVYRRAYCALHEDMHLLARRSGDVAPG